MVAVAVLVILAAVTRAGNDEAVLNLGVIDVNTTALGIFLAGAVTLLVLVLGLWLIASGLRRARQKRSEVKQLRREAQESSQRSSDQAARPVAPPESRRGDKRRVVEEPGVVREPIEEEQSGPAPTAERPAGSPGPDEHFDSAPRER
jgi:ABC-type nickel/cobalt efflux system permease component RcnA